MATQKKAVKKNAGKNSLTGGSGDPRRGSDLDGGAGPKGGGKSAGGKKKK
jgi:hypothetical protein